MPERSIPTVHIRNFGLKDRLTLQLSKHYPQILDADQHNYVTEAVEKHGFGFVRAQLPQDYAYINPEEKKEYPASRNIMLRVSKDDEGYRLYRVPGLHVVTGAASYGEFWDAFAGFRQILTYGFHGGPYVNTYLAEEDHMHTLTHYGYPGNSAMDKKITTDREGIEGDSYRVLLWSGFTGNYSPSSEVDTRVNPYGQGTVAHCPQSRLQPFIVLPGNASVAQRIDYYRSALPANLPNPVRVLDSRFAEVAVL